MLKFSAGTPFPLITPQEHSYLEAQLHSEAVDRWLGLDVAGVEARLEVDGCRHKAPGSGRKQELWIGLASRSLLTPYTEIRQILNRLNPRPGSTVVDLGAAYGRMAFVVGRHHEGVKFIGYEYVGERLKEGQRIIEGMKNPFLKLVHADLSAPDFSPEPADFYFIYDFGTFNAVEKILHDVRAVAQERPVTVVGRGRLCRDIIERRHPWLSQVVPPAHHGHSSVYRTAF